MKQPIWSVFGAIFYNYIVNNFRMCDALPYAKDGTLSEKLDELFG